MCEWVMSFWFYAEDVSLGAIGDISLAYFVLTRRRAWYIMDDHLKEFLKFGLSTWSTLLVFVLSVSEYNTIFVSFRHRHFCHCFF